MLVIRDFEKKDSTEELLETLKEVWSVDEINESTLDKWFKNDNHMVIAEFDGKIVGSATLHLQQKIIRNGGIAGCIEDVVVREDYRGNNIGAQLIQELIKKAENFGCYKVILSCFPERINFYKKNGFNQESITMRFDLKKNIIK
jgi:glucosamine-phosphate N-acetyltransferase